MKRRNFLLALSIIIIFTAIAFTKGTVAYSSGGTLAIVSIDYEREVLTISTSGNDSKVYFADSKTASKWETLSGEFDNNQITMDISWASKTKNVIFFIKGDVSTTPVQVTLPKQSANFTASLNYSTNTVAFSGLGNVKEVYWRKSTSTLWTKLELTTDNKSPASFEAVLERFYIQGITLYFRTGQTAGSSTNAGSRPSKEVSIKITKRASAPSVQVNNSSLTVNAKNTMQYKTSDMQWTDITGSYLKLEDVLESVLYEKYNRSDDEAEAYEAAIDIRTKATSAKPASKAVTLVVNGQKAAPNAKEVSLEYTGSSQLMLTIPLVRNDDGSILYKGASTSNPYEYTVVDKDKELDLAAASWTSITSSSGITITSSKAPTGSKIYVRKKSTSSSLASHYISITVDSYPSVAVIDNEDKKLYNKIKGVDGDGLSFCVLLDEKTQNIDNYKITSVEFENSKNNSVSVEFKQSSATKINGMNYYGITITITDFSSIESKSDFVDTLLYSRIKTSGDNEAIIGGVRLYIYPAASITRLDDKGNVSKSDINVFIEAAYKSAYQTGDVFKVSLGSETKGGVTVKSVKLGDHVFNENDYKTVYSEKDCTASITLSSSALDTYKNTLKTSSSKIGKPYHLTITLSNDEVLTSDIGITVKSLASITSTTTSFIISKSTWKNYVTELAAYNNNLTSAIANGVTLTMPTAPYTNPTFTFSIDSEFKNNYSDTYNVSILKDVTWNEKSILYSFSGSSVTLNINRMIEIAGESGNSGAVKLVFSNGTDFTVETTFIISVVE